MAPRIPTGERIAKLETEVKNLYKLVETGFANNAKKCAVCTKSITRLNEELGDVVTVLGKFDTRLGVLEKEFKSFIKESKTYRTTVLNDLRNWKNHVKGGLSGRDKAAIAISLISAITSIIVTIVSVFPR